MSNSMYRNHLAIDSLSAAILIPFKDWLVTVSRQLIYDILGVLSLAHKRPEPAQQWHPHLHPSLSIHRSHLADTTTASVFRVRISPIFCQGNPRHRALNNPRHALSTPRCNHQWLSKAHRHLRLLQRHPSPERLPLNRQRSQSGIINL